MGKIIKITAGAVVVIVMVSIAAFLWWSDQGPEAVDMEAAVAQLEVASLDDTGGNSVEGEDNGAGSGSGPGTSVAEADPADRGDAPTTAPGPDSETISEDTGAVTVTTSGETPAGNGLTDNVGTTLGTGPQPSVPLADEVVNDEESSLETETTRGGSRADAFSGLWTVSTPGNADGLPGEPAVSFAGFRVVEVLAGGVAESTAVGRTAGVTGLIELAGYALVAGTVEVEIATLRTDNSHRDSHMRQALNTEEFPMAVFSLIEPVELPAGIFEGETFSGSVQGNLTIKGVTNRAVFDLKARLVGNTIVAVGSAQVVFSDYGVTAPRSASVIWVEEHGVMEFQLYFTR